ncbi:MAG: tRNA (N(6)-L-threonylcarbamoyladenosine(37)-C(2))-methylthiotransferase MtaB [Myxococcota bacterium]
MRIHLAALGCRLNEAELQGWTRQLHVAGHQVVAHPRDADVCVVNSCAVTAEASRKSRQLVRRLHRLNPRAKLAVSGCDASLQPVQTGQLPGVHWVVPNTQKDQLVARLLQDIESQYTTQENRDDLAKPPATTINTKPHAARTRAFVKVQDGCRNRCSFCIVTVARGAERSRRVSDVLQTVRALQQEGVQEVVFTGVHLGGYGSDIQSSLVELLQTVLACTHIPRVRLGSLEPWDLPEDFFALWRNPRLMPHVHLPLQSGCDSVLARMSRRCMTRSYSQLVQQARKHVPHMQVTTDVIVGFPGETEQEWQQTLDFVQQMQFGHIHVFPYSARDGTKAYSMPDKVSYSVKRQRCAQLREFSVQMTERFAVGLHGRIANVLYEQPALKSDDLPAASENDSQHENEILYVGYTPNYMRVVTPFAVDHNPQGQIVPTCVGSFHKQHKACLGVQHGCAAQLGM